MWRNKISSNLEENVFRSSWLCQQNEKKFLNRYYWPFVNPTKIMQNQVHWGNEYLNPSSKKEKPYPVVNFFFFSSSPVSYLIRMHFFIAFQWFFYLFIYLTVLSAFDPFVKDFVFCPYPTIFFRKIVAFHFVHFSFLVAHSYSFFFVMLVMVHIWF